MMPIQTQVLTGQFLLLAEQLISIPLRYLLQLLVQGL